MFRTIATAIVVSVSFSLPGHTETVDLVDGIFPGNIDFIVVTPANNANACQVADRPARAGEKLVAGPFPSRDEAQKAMRQLPACRN